MSKATAIFQVTPKRGRLIFDNTLDLERFCIENDEIEHIVSFEPKAKVSNKLRMYNYLFGVIMHYSIKAFEKAGYEGMDKVKAKYILQSMFAKGDMINPDGVIETYLIDLSSMDKFRLLKFIQDTIFYLESEHGQEIPDSQTYKEMKLNKKEK